MTRTLCRAATTFLCSALFSLGICAEEIRVEAGFAFQECDECPQMVVIPPGSFTMGFDGGLPERYEGPPHEVTIDYSFAIGRFEVTQAQYRSFIELSGYKPSKGCYMWTGFSADFVDANGWEDPGYGRPPADDEPVACIDWRHAKAYVTWLAEHTGQPYRLITEAEWEYAARAGRPSTDTYTWGNSEDDACTYANILDQSEIMAQPDLPMPPAACDDGLVGVAPVGSLKANPFGLSDMTGNVWEWLEDCYVMPYAPDGPRDGSAYIDEICDRHSVRGGSWLSTLFWQRPTFRGRDPVTQTSRIFGLRVARDLP